MAFGNSRVSLRARWTIAAVSMGAIAIVAFAVVMFGSQIGAAITASPNSQIAGQAIPASAGRTYPRASRRRRCEAPWLYFEKNQGQVNSSVRYLARSGRYSLFLTDDAASVFFDWWRAKQGDAAQRIPPRDHRRNEDKQTQSAVRVRLVGANPHRQAEGLERLQGRVNYLI